MPIVVAILFIIYRTKPLFQLGLEFYESNQYITRQQSWWPSSMLFIGPNQYSNLGDDHDDPRVDCGQFHSKFEFICHNCFRGDVGKC